MKTVYKVEYLFDGVKYVKYCTGYDFDWYPEEEESVTKDCANDSASIGQERRTHAAYHSTHGAGKAIPE